MSILAVVHAPETTLHGSLVELVDTRSVRVSLLAQDAETSSPLGVTTKTLDVQRLSFPDGTAYRVLAEQGVSPREATLTLFRSGAAEKARVHGEPA